MGLFDSIFGALDGLREPLIRRGDQVKDEGEQAAAAEVTEEVTEEVGAKGSGKEQEAAQLPKPKTATELVVSVVGAIITAVAGALTLTGFATLVGGAVYWTRFEAVGIPYDQAVAVVEPTQLLVVGTSVIAVFLVTAVLAVLILFALDSSGWVSRATLLGVGGLVAAATIYVVTVPEFGDLERFGLILAAVALAFICLAVGDQTGRRFIPFGAAVFIAVVVWGGVLGFLNAQALDQLQAGAVFGGKDVRAARGFYVSDDEKTIYLARPLPERLANSPAEDFDDKGLLEIERKEGTRLAIGPLQDADIARRESKVLLRKLKAQSAKQGRLDARARAEAAASAD